jgi:hypothetical protein
MKTRSLLVRFLAALSLTFALTAGQLGAQSAYNDATGDISSSLPTAGGTLDIVSMEVSETATDLVFTLTVNGDISSTDWGNFMLGIANTKLAGTPTGNGWGRPINMAPPSGSGMTHWIGSWVNDGGGSQLWTYNGTNWNGPAALAGYSFTAGPQSTIEYSVTKASLSYEPGDVLFFDAYSSGSGADSAVDALSNPNVAITGWGGPYTSGIATGISRYPQAAGVSANITFQVDMNAQIAAGNFDPVSDILEVVPVGNAAFAQADMNEIPGQPGIYAVTAFTTAPLESSVAYRFQILGLSDLPEDLNRAFAMPAIDTTLPVVFFDDIPAYRNVTFRVDMNEQITAQSFDPLTQYVLVAGNFNGFSVDPEVNPALTDGDEDGIYEGTFLIGGASGSVLEYKFVTMTGTDASYEFPGANRSAELELNPDEAFDPAQVLPVAIYGIPDNARPVTFTVDMSFEANASPSRFNPAVDNVTIVGAINDWNTGSTAYQLTRQGDTLVYSGTFNIGGTEGTTLNYKFYTNARPGDAGYEPGADRVLTLGPVVTPQVLPLAVFGITASQFRNITFAVDMSVQVALGLFNPDETDPAVGGIVQVRGINGNFESGPLLAREGSSLVYSGTFEVGGNEETSFGYKFWSPGVVFYEATDPSNTGFEIINQGSATQNRTVILSASGTPMDLGTVFFSNQLFFTTGTPLTAFTAEEGAPSAAQTVTVTGQGLTADIVATAPTGFEVSSDGLNYGPTANIVPVSGSVADATLSVRISASAALGALSGNVTLTSTGSQPANVAVSGTVTSPTSVVTASDSGANYTDGWTNGANGGSGFGAWNITTSTNTNAFAGAFIGDPAVAGITDFGTNAFGLYANPSGSGAFVNAGRTFPALQVGQTLRFQWAVNFDSEGGNKGFNVFGNGEQLVNVNQGSFPGDIVVNIGTNSVNTSNSITYGTSPMTWSFTRTTADNLLVTSTGRDGSTNIAFSTNVAIVTGPDAVSWYAADMGAGDARQPYFNNLQISGPIPVTNQVTFSVDMTAEIAAGNFDPTTGVVEVRGEFNAWSGDALTNVGGNIYEGTFPISGTTGTPVFYKFWATDLDYEFGSDRSFTIGTAGQTQILPTVNFEPTPTREVTFSVNMSVQIILGNFDPAAGLVEVRGSFNGFSGGDVLTDPDGNGIYSGTFTIAGAEDATVFYKFWASGLDYELQDAPDRTFVLGANGEPQILPTVYFSNDSGQVRDITFSVDMSVQAALGLFDPATGVVELRGLGSFDAADAKTLDRVGATLVYSGTFPVEGEVGTDVFFKFYSAGLNYFVETDPSNPGFEIINQEDPVENRQVTLGTSGEPQTVEAYFSNQLFGLMGTEDAPLPDSSFDPFTSSQGTPSFPQSVSVSGVGLTADIIVTAPTGFEVSSDGTTFDQTAAIAEVDGSVNSAELFVRVAAAATPGSISGRVILESAGSQSTSVNVSATVTSAYDTWAGSFGLNPATNGAPTADPDGDSFTNAQEYAFGTSPIVANGALLATTASGGNLVVTWLERSGVTYNVQSTANLATTPFANDGTVSVVNGPTEPTPPAGYTRKQFSVPTTGAKFYRVSATTP